MIHDADNNKKCPDINNHDIYISSTYWDAWCITFWSTQCENESNFTLVKSDFKVGFFQLVNFCQRLRRTGTRYWQTDFCIVSLVDSSISKNCRFFRNWSVTWWSADYWISSIFHPFYKLDTRNHQEHDAKVRLPIPCLSSSQPLAEIDQLKKIRPNPVLVDPPRMSQKPIRWYHHRAGKTRDVQTHRRPFKLKPENPSKTTLTSGTTTASVTAPAAFSYFGLGDIIIQGHRSIVRNHFF